MLCYVMLCYVMLCYVMLCVFVLFCFVLFCFVLFCLFIIYYILYIIYYILFIILFHEDKSVEMNSSPAFDVIFVPTIVETVGDPTNAGNTWSSLHPAAQRLQDGVYCLVHVYVSCVLCLVSCVLCMWLFIYKCHFVLLYLQFRSIIYITFM